MRLHATLSILLVTAACSTPPATAEQRAQAERRLLAPFLVDRVVGCSELRVELTGNFHRNVGRPAHDPKCHSLTREQGDGFVETVWTNLSGAPEHAFVLAVGATQEIPDGADAPPRTRFRVVNQLRIRVYEDRRPLTLAAAASGLVLVQDGKAAPRDVKGFAIADGAAQPQ